MSPKKVVAVLLIIIVIGAIVYFSTNPLSILVLEVSYTTFPVIVNDQLQDVEFTFKVDRYFSKVPSYQFMGQYQVVDGQNKLSFFDLNINFTLNVDIFREPENATLENGTLWRSYNFGFSSVLERKIRIYCRSPANVTLGNRATIVVDLSLVAWYEGQAPYVDKMLHKEFTVDIP